MRDDWLGDGAHDGQWHDFSVIFEGPAVSGARRAFAENWLKEGGGLLAPSELDAKPHPSGTARAAFVASTSHPVVTQAERLMQLMILAAHERIWIENAYFVPTKPILDLLGEKAERGVDVRILVAGRKSDSKTSFGAQQVEYGDLLERGVRIYEYTPSMMHAKTLVVDDRLGLIGSSNLDPLSLNELEEGALVFEGAASVNELAATFEHDTKLSKQIRGD